ncbi:TerC family protein [bacterium]|nr:TerC family protein [bacterium]
MKVLIFPFSEYWWFYLGFTIFVLGMLALDLGVFHRKAHEVTFREASLWTLTWFLLAGVFNIGFYFYCISKLGDAGEGLVKAKQLALEFLTGFVVEKSLAVDNIFVFAIVFSYFGIPRLYQHRVLFFGILGALLFRALFIALGSQLMAYHAVVVFFGLVLIVTGIKMFFSESQMMDPERVWFMKFLRRLFRIDPSAAPSRFFIKRDGVRYATPLFLALLFIEVSDILFAIDSVPAIFALTREPLIVFTSNIFAILGLRSMFFMLSGALEKFRYIKYGLAAVLVFVGLKMAWLNPAFDGKFPVTWSLGIIVCLIGGSIAVSWVKARSGAER